MERRFECTGCGKCCYGNPATGVTRADHDEQKRVARHMGMPLAVFRARHIVRYADGSEGFTMRTGKCEFLTPENKCAIYAVRPRQCSSYPRWEHLLEDDAAWNNEKARCEGIGRGPVIEIVNVEVVKRA